MATSSPRGLSDTSNEYNNGDYGSDARSHALTMYAKPMALVKPKETHHRRAGGNKLYYSQKVHLFEGCYSGFP
jgi:hypothetical protein